MTRDNAQRRKDYARKKEMFRRLKLQADILYDSNSEREQTIVLNRMMLIILEVVGQRKLNDVRRQAIANHFTDSAVGGTDCNVELGGEGDRDIIHLSGSFRIDDLAKRITWSEERGGPILDM